jgi:hypothetical protein
MKIVGDDYTTLAARIRRSREAVKRAKEVLARGTPRSQPKIETIKEIDARYARSQAAISRAKSLLATSAAKELLAKPDLPPSIKLSWRGQSITFTPGKKGWLYN